MKRGMTFEYLMCRADLNFEVDFGVNGAIVFGRAIHSLSKIGEELYLESLPAGLALRTVNLSRSAYACFVFDEEFFVEYDSCSHNTNRDMSDDDDNDDGPLKCKIGMKSCLAIFHSLGQLEKSVDRCHLSHDSEDCKLVIRLYLKFDIVRTYHLSYVISETLQAVYSKDLSPNILTAQSKLLSDVVSNFQMSQEEVTLIVNPQMAKLKNYNEDQKDKKVINTELKLEPEEFDVYQIGVDTEVTFCLKELRGILAFSEHLNLPLSTHIESAGLPIVFSFGSGNCFEANFVLATLANVGLSQIQPTTSHNSSVQQPAPKIRHNPYTSHNNNTIHRKSNQTIEQARNRTQANNTTIPHFPEDDISVDTSVDTTTGSNAPSFTTFNTSRTNHGNSSTLNTERNTTRNKPAAVNRNNNTAKNTTSLSKTQTTNQSISIMKARPQAASLFMDSSSSEDEMNDTIPGTPPAKKCRSLFFGLSQSTGEPCTQSQKANVVLAEDTSDEDG